MTEPNECGAPENGKSEADTPAEVASPSWRFKLPTALHTIAFSTVIAALTGIASCLGVAFALGRKDALGLYALTSEPIDGSHIFLGMMLTGQVFVDCLLVVILARILYLGGRWIVKKTGLVRWLSPTRFIKEQMWLFALLVACVDSFVLVGSMEKLANNVDGIPFKSFAEIGNAWTRVLFETTPDTVINYTFLYCALLTLLVSLCWWLVSKGLDRPIRKIIVSTMGLLVVFVTLLMFSYLRGAAATVKKYPVVSFSNQIAQFGESSVPILLGQDDKMFAFLIVLTGAKPGDELQKMIVFIPRSEIKSLSVLRTVPLYELEKFDDLLRLGLQMRGQKQ